MADSASDSMGTPATVPPPAGYDPTPEEMKINVADVLEGIKAATAELGPDAKPPRLVAISKTKGLSLLQSAYDAGLRVFGENYVHEIEEKAPQMPPDVAWHFVGHLQSNKVKAVLSAAPNLAVIETVDSAKLADKINNGVALYRGGNKLSVFVQVNTSGEESKSGVEPTAEGVVALATHIAKNCPDLVLGGLMTIGMKDYTSKPENFECLMKCRADVAAALGIEASTLELSMGMSGDYLNAIRMGSTNVRVGSKIFGARNYKK